jgi:hypothetical protein
LYSYRSKEESWSTAGNPEEEQYIMWSKQYKLKSGLYRAEHLLTKLKRKRRRISYSKNKDQTLFINNLAANSVQELVNEEALNQLIDEYSLKKSRTDGDKYKFIKNALKYYRVFKADCRKNKLFLIKLANAFDEPTNEIKVSMVILL